MAQHIWGENEGWNIVMGSKVKSHYFNQDEIKKDQFPRTLCGSLIINDVLPERSESGAVRCKKCEKLRQNQQDK